MQTPEAVLQHLLKRLENLREAAPSNLQVLIVEDLSLAARTIRSLMMQRPDNLSLDVLERLSLSFPGEAELSFSVGLVQTGGERHQFGTLRAGDRFFQFRFKPEAFANNSGAVTLQYFEEMCRIFAQQPEQNLKPKLSHTRTKLSAPDIFGLPAHKLLEPFEGDDPEEIHSASILALMAVVKCANDGDLLGEAFRTWLLWQVEEVEKKIYRILETNTDPEEADLESYSDKDLSVIFLEMLADLSRHLGGNPTGEMFTK